MRLQMAAGKSAAAISVGSTAGVGLTGQSTTAVYSTTNPASGTGTLTAATTTVAGSGVSLYFFSVNPATMTVRAISGTVTSSGSTSATYAISLAVVAGDYIGVSVAASGTTIFRYDASGGAGFARVNFASPTVGTSVAGWTATASPALFYLSAAS